MSLHHLLRNWALALLQPLPLVGLTRIPRYVRDWRRFASLQRGARPALADSYPCLADWTSTTHFDPHYFYQGAWLARRLAVRRPAGLHVDVGSSVLTLSVLSAAVETLFLDIRPLVSHLRGLHCVAADIGRLPLRDGTVDSISCLHVIEHIGLGRYGDAIDPAGAASAAAQLAAVVAPGGRLYLSTPVGRGRVCFNAHRVFDPEAVPIMFPGLSLVEFCYVDDAGVFHEGVATERAGGCDYACGMFILERPA